VIDNPHQSDLTVKIYSVLHVLIDYTSLQPGALDNDAYLSDALSRAFGQTWLVANSLGAVTREAFHARYLVQSAAVRDCYASVVCVQPATLCAAPADVDLFVGSVLRVNRVLGRRVLFLLPRPDADSNAAASAVVARYRELVEGFVAAPPASLARASIVAPSVNAVADAVRAWLTA
jgi:hypothetical protein